MEEDGGGNTIGIPREMDGEMADVLAREHGEAKTTPMMQNRVGEGLATWEGQMRPRDVIAVAIAAGAA